MSFQTFHLIFGSLETPDFPLSIAISVPGLVDSVVLVDIRVPLTPYPPPHSRTFLDGPENFLLTSTSWWKGPEYPLDPGITTWIWTQQGPRRLISSAMHRKEVQCKWKRTLNSAPDTCLDESPIEYHGTNLLMTLSQKRQDQNYDRSYIILPEHHCQNDLDLWEKHTQAPHQKYGLWFQKTLKWTKHLLHNIPRTYRPPCQSQNPHQNPAT